MNESINESKEGAMAARNPSYSKPWYYDHYGMMIHVQKAKLEDAVKVHPIML